jgi:hypothetical protein
MFRVNMMRIVLLVYLISFLAFSGWVVQSTGLPEITTPESGQVLQGAVSITGSSLVSGFQSAEISFSYDTDPSDTWFVFSESQEPVERGELAVLDTTTLTDGNYRLRLRVYLEGDEEVETVIRGLRIRNYSAIETATPEAVVIVVEETLTPLPPTRTPFPTPAELPPNPAVVTDRNLQASIAQGILITLAVFGLVGLYLALKKLIQRS